MKLNLVFVGYAGFCTAAGVFAALGAIIERSLPLAFFAAFSCGFTVACVLLAFDVREVMKAKEP